MAAKRKPKDAGEPRSNLVFLCAEHSPKPDPQYRTRDPQSFIGHFVKMGFPTRVPGTLEHCWVKIHAASRTYLIGKLDNDPYYDIGFMSGDMVLVDMRAIEDEFAPEEVDHA